jgi:hypothetical protein
MISMQRTMHSSQMFAATPAMSECTSLFAFPQNPHCGSSIASNDSLRPSLAKEDGRKCATFDPRQRGRPSLAKVDAVSVRRVAFLTPAQGSRSSSSDAG